MSPPSPSKPYQVLELLPVWEGTTEDDRLVHFLSYCHGNNSCDQSALARADSGRPGGRLPRVNVGWTDAEAISKKLSPLSGKDWSLRRNRHTSPQRQIRKKEEKKNKQKKNIKTTGSILCCQCIVDRRKPVRTATSWHRNLAHVDPLSRFVSPFELYLTLPPVHPPLLSHPPPPPP